MKMTVWLIKRSVLGMVAMAGLALTLPVAAYADIAPQTCDTAVWDTMKARAQLETEREVMQNQNLIFKADSVLVYTCFDKLAGHASHALGPLFTTTSYWGSPIITQSAMDSALSGVLLTALSSYLSGNFNHTLLGGRSSITYTPSPSISGGGYGCNQMNQAWNVAKCSNFIHNNSNAADDGFFPLKDLKGHGGSSNIAGYATKGDVRNLPTSCSSPVPGNYWSTGVDASLNVGETYAFKAPTQTTFTNVLTMVDPTVGGCGDGVVRTGVTVITGPGDPSTFEDVVCVKPGCYPKSGACVSGGGGSSSSCSGPGPC